MDLVAGNSSVTDDILIDLKCRKVESNRRDKQQQRRRRHMSWKDSLRSRHNNNGTAACCPLLYFRVSMLLLFVISFWWNCLSIQSLLRLEKVDSPPRNSKSNSDMMTRRRLYDEQNDPAADDSATANTPSEPSSSSSSMRILYIITSLAEYNTGTRATQRGSDRLQETLIPVLTEGVESMLSLGYHVDVYLISHWTVRPDRLELIRSSLPPSVGLEIWDDAMPLGYVANDKNQRIKELEIHLARQHRFVIRDKLLYYDFFIAMEDDMLIHGEHVQHFVKVSNEVLRLRKDAPDELLPPPKGVNAADVFYGPLQKSQLRRLVPGLMRVEVLLDEERYGTQNTLAAIPVDLDFDGVNRTVNPRTCCHVGNKTVNGHIPAAPPSDKIFMWETGIEGLSVRDIPGLGYVAFLGGTSGFKASPVIGDYWSGREGEFGNLRRPRGHTAKFVGNQGGWMATRWQIFEWHADICLGGFLPPFDVPHYRFDGLDMRNVEWWSGGLGLFTYRHACNLQRIVRLDPQGFSNHLIYHSANNKQTQLNLQGKKDRFVKVDNLLGQLNTVRKRAEETKRKEEHAKKREQRQS